MRCEFGRCCSDFEHKWGHMNTQKRYFLTLLFLSSTLLYSMESTIVTPILLSHIESSKYFLSQEIRKHNLPFNVEDINARIGVEQISLLMHACAYLKDEYVSIALKLGADVNQQGGNGFTPLYYVFKRSPNYLTEHDCKEKRKSIVDCLLKAGAKLNIFSPIELYSPFQLMVLNYFDEYKNVLKTQLEENPSLRAHINDNIQTAPGIKPYPIIRQVIHCKGEKAGLEQIRFLVQHGARMPEEIEMRPHLPADILKILLSNGDYEDRTKAAAIFSNGCQLYQQYLTQKDPRRRLRYVSEKIKLLVMNHNMSLISFDGWTLKKLIQDSLNEAQELKQRGAQFIQHSSIESMSMARFLLELAKQPSPSEPDTKAQRDALVKDLIDVGVNRTLRDDQGYTA